MSDAPSPAGVALALLRRVLDELDELDADGFAWRGHQSTTSASSL